MSLINIDKFHCEKCGKLKLTRTRKPHTCEAENPKAIITLSEEGGMLNVKIEFTPSANTTGEIHRSHKAALQMVNAFAAKQKALN